ncbi:uncharacterized protein HMPREF1541_01120 [Cyphellophora europaea CBS 101466]|uniref:Uncharacterized protein n=1 Tax=Cyphellophora europaea (strain CBS 101466) TaxID=1220924 RepID=W2SDY8_CYPE1|nr:uncharacterized protein HMPREF1541_01120 [Cyphellophora europaea CBS 101466]ETN46931.1 hypothetical protein HMPREF1541_01120 [Cyphellophora europaea CBS 101466]
MANIYEALGVPLSGFNSRPFISSWLLPQDALAAIRLTISIYVVASISYSYAYFASHKVTFHLQDVNIKPISFQVGAEGIRQSFSYFTYISYWSQSFYFFFAALHTFVGARQGIPWLDKWPRPLQALHSIYYTCITTLPFLVSSIYWSSMYVGPWFQHDFDRWSALSIHGINSAFALFEVAMIETRPQPWTHLGILLLIMGLYLPIPYITRATEGIYIYLWLDPNNGIAQLIAHIVGYAMAIVVIFNVSRGAVWLRCRINQEAMPEEMGLDYSGSGSSVSRRSSSKFSTLKAFGPSGDLEKIREMSSVNIPLVGHDRTAHGSIYQGDPQSRMSTTTIAMSAQFHEASSTHIPLPPEPESALFPAIYPRRSSSYHVRNFSRPTSQATTAPSLRGFWL